MSIFDSKERLRQALRQPPRPEPTAPNARPEGLTIDLPLARYGRYYSQFRTDLMHYASDLLDEQRRRGRECGWEVWTCELAERADIHMQTNDDYQEFLPWAKQARAMAQTYRERAAANGGQYLIW